MARLVLVDTADQLPGLLPLHSWRALEESDLVLLGDAAHPFAAHLDAAGTAYELVPTTGEGAALSRADLLSGLTPEEKGRAAFVVDRALERGRVAYVFGPGDGEGFTRTVGMEAARAGVEVEVVYFAFGRKGLALLDLVAVLERLRAPGGCPWDREQTHATLAEYAVEELYELLEAIAAEDADAIREELGDVLLQVVFHAQIAEDEGRFAIDDVARGISEKLVRRHPHVFGDVEVADADEVVANWEDLKAAEKPERSGLFDGVVPTQPAVAYARKLQSRAAKTGFDWTADEEAAERIHLEVEEFCGASSDREREKELGDLLFSVVGLARRHGIDPELALRGAAFRFRRRVEFMSATAAKPLRQLGRDEWLALWDEAKADERADDEPS